MRLLPVLVLLAVSAVPAFGAVEPLAGSHLSELSCGDCHPGTTSEGNFTGEITDCDGCHSAVENIHPIDMVPKTPVPAGFRLSKDGRMLCLTCHKVHGGEKEWAYLNDAASGYKKGRGTYCANCHGSERARTNPHSARTGDPRCTFCHKTLPEEGKPAAKTLRVSVVKLCDFCHGATEKQHPKNIDPVLSIPSQLPRGPDGNWTCATCHDPHGTISTTHYTRPVYAKYMERGKNENPHKPDYFACSACHTESNTKGIRVQGVNLRYKGDINVLCISCHVTDKGHHPSGFELPPAMMKRLEKSPISLPLDSESKMDCITCHDTGCTTGQNTMSMRYYNSKTYDTSLCWGCHDREEYAKVNPHVTDPDQCTKCHETRPVKGMEVTLMTVPIMVCIHCHEVKPHPIGKSHMAKPTSVIKVDPALPVAKNGEVVCITCHEPHYDPVGRPRRLRVVTEEKQICGMCHWKS